MAVILGCSCKSEYQDEKYGKGQRVHNEGVKQNKCTVCGTKK